MMADSAFWGGKFRIDGVLSAVPPPLDITYTASDLRYDEYSEEEGQEFCILAHGDTVQEGPGPQWPQQQWRVPSSASTDALLALAERLDTQLRVVLETTPGTAEASPTTFHLMVLVYMRVQTGTPCVPKQLLRHIHQLFSACSTVTPASFALDAVYQAIRPVGEGSSRQWRLPPAPAPSTSCPKACMAALPEEVLRRIVAVGKLSGKIT